MRGQWSRTSSCCCKVYLVALRDDRITLVPCRQRFCASMCPRSSHAGTRVSVHCVGVGASSICCSGCTELDSAATVLSLHGFVVSNLRMLAVYGLFVQRTVRLMDVSPYVWTFRPMGDSPHGRFAPHETFRPIDDSPIDVSPH